LGELGGCSGCGFGVEEWMIGRSVIDRPILALMFVVIGVTVDFGPVFLNVLNPVEPGTLLY